MGRVADQITTLAVQTTEPHLETGKPITSVRRGHGDITDIGEELWRKHYKLATPQVHGLQYGKHQNIDL
jgi:hypothetical protein